MLMLFHWRRQVKKFYRDSELIGFAVRATTKSKSYIIERRNAGELYRVVLGKTNEISTLSARAKAQTILAKIANGEYVKPSKKQVVIIHLILQYKKHWIFI